MYPVRVQERKKESGREKERKREREWERERKEKFGLHLPETVHPVFVCV